MMRAGELAVGIDTATGRLQRVQKQGESIPLSDGPRLVPPSSDSLTNFEHYAAGDSGHVVEATFAGDADFNAGNLEQIRWQLLPSGWLKLDYRYHMRGAYDHVGVTFDYPEKKVTGMKWLGRGPYRVWKNRRKGVTFNVWQKAYNDTRTGIEWNYPEFKGHHADFHWAVIQTTERPLTVVAGTNDLFLRMLTPSYGPEPGHAKVEFPDGDLSFLNGIAPIGTKFRPPIDTGPSGRENYVYVLNSYEGTLYFYFGDDLSARSATVK
jgi:hypothetical protein